MEYYSRTVTEPAEKPVEVEFESNSTHHIFVVDWKHCYKDTIAIEVTNSPLRIEANSFDGLNHHGLEFTLNLNYDVVTLADAFYDFSDTGFRIHIPKENMKRQESETVTLPFKK